MKKAFCFFMSVLLVLSLTTTAFAASSEEDAKQAVVNYMVAINSQIGYYMTAEEESVLADQVDASAQVYCNQYGITMEEAYNQLLEELQTSLPLSEGMQARSGGGELKSLPSATAGDIFYVDSNSAWNHVGLYQTSTVIVEAMPDDGVQFWSIYNQESYQEPVENPADNSNDSCILRVSSLSSTTRGNVATWPSNNITAGTPYDYDFLNNKSDYYTVNMGTTDMPNYVTYPESDAYNCSELVWKAFKKVASVDLDNNGGLGVYPNDIYNSSLTVSVNSTWWQ